MVDFQLMGIMRGQGDRDGPKNRSSPATVFWAGRNEEAHYDLIKACDHLIPDIEVSLQEKPPIRWIF